MLLVVSVGLTSHAHAQSPIKFGITGGANIANLNDSDLNTDPKVGFTGGIYSRFKIPASPMSIQPEVLFSQKGAEGDDISATLNYIEIPVLARFGFILDGPVTPNVYFGPYVGFNTKAEGEGPNIAFNIEDAVNKTDAGVVIGADVQITRFTIGGRYSAGLVEVFEDDDATAKNGVFSVMVGVSF